jgi:hypothetical protein
MASGNYISDTNKVSGDAAEPLYQNTAELRQSYASREDPTSQPVNLGVPGPDVEVRGFLR